MENQSLNNFPQDFPPNLKSSSSVVRRYWRSYNIGKQKKKESNNLLINQTNSADQV